MVYNIIYRILNHPGSILIYFPDNHSFLLHAFEVRFVLKQHFLNYLIVSIYFQILFLGIRYFDNLLDDIKYLVDINVLWGRDIVEINGIKMTIKVELPEELKDYDSYEIVYVSDKQIKERIPATVKDGYIYFETTHLSQYGIVAKNNSRRLKLLLPL